MESHKYFYVKNCFLASVATGEHAGSLLELRNKIATIEEGCLYYHFWGGRMHPEFVHSQHHNDFASWIFHRLHDSLLAERLSIIDPTEFENLGALRQEILEIIDNRLDDYETIYWTKREGLFHFIRSIIMVFETPNIIKIPEDLPHVLKVLPPSSIFYHFIDARTRTAEKIDDFSLWLQSFGDPFSSLIKEIQSIDPYFLSLTELKQELLKKIEYHFEKI